jgi:hypothetical protein
LAANNVSTATAVAIIVVVILSHLINAPKDYKLVPNWIGLFPAVKGSAFLPLVWSLDSISVFITCKSKSGGGLLGLVTKRVVVQLEITSTNHTLAADIANCSNSRSRGNRYDIQAAST